MKQTKKQLLAAAANGEGIADWYIQILRFDADFEAELLKCAHLAGNQKFLDCIIAFKANLQSAAQRPSQPRIQPARSFPTSKTAPRPFVLPNQPFKQKYRSKSHSRRRPDYSLRPVAPPPIDAKTLPAHMVIRVLSNDFTNCPRCKMRLQTKVLADHLAKACPFRGQVEGSAQAAPPPWSGDSYNQHWSPW